MTESEWLSAIEPHSLLEYLQNSGKQNSRKLRLFAVACSGRMWSGIDPLGKNAVEVAERFADGLADANEMRAARLACQGAGSQAAWYAAASNPAIAARNAARSAQTGAASEVDELLAQANLLRDIFGNPLRSIMLDPTWLTPNVKTLAHSIYEERAFERMPELAGILEDASCTNEEILSHCREPALHARGCWLVDVLLGRA